MSHLSRRQLLRGAAGAAAGLALAPLAVADEKKATGFTLPPLPYPFDALEPAIDAKTMQIHHDAHHKAYVDNLNKALMGHPKLLEMDVYALLRHIKEVPEDIRQAVINNGGGHANHSFFWHVMAPKAGGEPTGAVAKAIDGAFGSFAKFQEQFTDAAMKRFGSGWAWLVADGKGALSILSTANQDSPLLPTVDRTPLLGIDVWEHAYYLKYQNKRADYVKAWWGVVNWKFVGDRLASAGK
jgi:Fe-Mn family superoxide dismutase